MKRLNKSVLIVATLSLVLTSLNSFSMTYKTGKGDKEENIETLYDQLEKAVDTRRFDTAKEAVNKMLPLMKKDIRDGKKILSGWDKDESMAEINKNIFASHLIIKNEIYTSTKGLINSSPAAIRVKGKQLVDMINEYISLVNQ